MLFKTANLSQLGEFDEIIDVRTPAEFAEDHIPGAINSPVLSDEERITIGTLYKQVSPFEARKAGAALVAKNIAHHLQTRFHDRPKSWRPLIYCWRGGQRSGAVRLILSQVCGRRPGEEPPSQNGVASPLRKAMQSLDPPRPVLGEAERNKSAQIPLAPA